MSVPQRNCTRTVELPSTVLEVTWYMPGTEDTACSIGRVTWASISSGATLGHWVTMATTGNETAGSRSIGRRVRQMAPSSTSAAIRMVTATGRVTEKRAKFMGNSWVQAFGRSGVRAFRCYRTGFFGRIGRIGRIGWLLSPVAGTPEHLLCLWVLGRKGSSGARRAVRRAAPRGAARAAASLTAGPAAADADHLSIF